MYIKLLLTRIIYAYRKKDKFECKLLLFHCFYICITFRKCNCLNIVCYATITNHFHITMESCTKVINYK